MTPIVGPPSSTLEAARRWAVYRGAADVFVDEMVPALWTAGLQVGVDPAVLVAQSAKETAFGRFGGVLDDGFHNTCGLKTAAGGGNYAPDAHQRFTSWRHGAEAHANHLGHAYCGLPPVGHVAPRTWSTATVSWAGTVVHVEELGGRWAPAAGYGHSIVTDYLTGLWEASMGRQLWLADKCREWGLAVWEEPGWKSRGSTSFAPKGVIAHHTAGAATGDYPSLRVVRDGRPGLSGPLSQIGLGRSGRVYVIAAGRANHAGAGGWKGLSGNSSVFGIEAESVGTRDDWTPAQREAYPVLCAALLDGLGRDASWLCGHKEWTSRKIDPAFWDMNQMRRDVAALLNPPAPEFTQEDDDDMTPFLAQAEGTPVFLITGARTIGVPTQTDLQVLQGLYGDTVHKVSRDFLRMAGVQV